VAVVRFGWPTFGGFVVCPTRLAGRDESLRDSRMAIDSLVTRNRQRTRTQNPWHSQDSLQGARETRSPVVFRIPSVWMDAWPPCLDSGLSWGCVSRRFRIFPGCTERLLCILRFFWLTRGVSAAFSRVSSSHRRFPARFRTFLGCTIRLLDHFGFFWRIQHVAAPFRDFSR